MNIVFFVKTLIRCPHVSGESHFGLTRLLLREDEDGTFRMATCCILKMILFKVRKHVDGIHWNTVTGCMMWIRRQGYPKRKDVRGTAWIAMQISGIVRKIISVLAMNVILVFRLEPQCQTLEALRKRWGNPTKEPTKRGRRLVKRHLLITSNKFQLMQTPRQAECDR